MPDETPKARNTPPRQPSEQYQWQKARLITRGGKAPPGCILTRGYGSDGSYSMFLPTPNAKRIVEFRDGKPRIAVVDSCMAIPAVATAREWLLRCATRAVPLAEMVADVSLVQYSVALLAVNYRLSDDDLAMLHAGNLWREPLIKHAMGGDGIVNALRQIAPERIREIARQAERSLTDAVFAMATVPDPAPLPAGVPVETADPETAAAVAAVVAAGETLEDEREEFDPTDL